MTKETIKTKCGIEIVRRYLSEVGNLCGTIREFDNENISIDLVKLPTPNCYIITIWRTTPRTYSEAVAIDGTEDEAIEEFESVCNRFKTEPTKWNLKI